MPRQEKIESSSDGVWESEPTESDAEEANGTVTADTADATADPDVVAMTGMLAALPPVSPVVAGTQSPLVPPTPPMSQLTIGTLPMPGFWWPADVARSATATPTRRVPADPSACPATPIFFDCPIAGGPISGPLMAPTTEAAASTPTLYQVDMSPVPVITDTPAQLLVTLSPAPAEDMGQT